LMQDSMMSSPIVDPDSAPFRVARDGFRVFR